jgi:hypothetical protein
LILIHIFLAHYKQERKFTWNYQHSRKITLLMWHDKICHTLHHLQFK